MSIGNFVATSFGSAFIGAVVGGGLGCCLCSLTCNPINSMMGGFGGAVAGGVIGFFAPAVTYTVAAFAQAAFKAIEAFFSRLGQTFGLGGKDVSPVVTIAPVIILIGMVVLLVLLMVHKNKKRSHPELD